MNREKWLQAYRTNKSAVWLRCKLTNGEEFNYDNIKGWIDLKQKCDKENVFISELYLQFRSNQVKIDVEGVEGVYAISSIKGQIGSDVIHSYTIGTIKNNTVRKKVLIIPDLTLQEEYDDRIENCFEETIIYDQAKKNREKQIQASDNG